MGELKYDSLITEFNNRRTEEKNKGQEVMHHIPLADWCPASAWAVSYPLPPSSPSFYCWAWHFLVWTVSLLRPGELSRLCPLPASCPPSVFLLERQCEEEEALTLCERCSLAANTGCWQCCLSHSSGRPQRVGCPRRGSSFPARLGAGTEEVGGRFLGCVICSSGVEFDHCDLSVYELDNLVRRFGGRLVCAGDAGLHWR